MNPVSVSDADWRAFLDDPCEATFAPVYDAAKGPALAVCRRLLGDEEDALDAFQSAWTRLVAEARSPAGAAELRRRDPVEAVLRFVSLESGALRKRRARIRRRTVPMDDRIERPDAAPSARDLAEATLRRERVEAVVAALPEDLRLPVQLRFLEGMTLARTAEALGAPLSTVASRIERALADLREPMRRAGLGEPERTLKSLAAAGAATAAVSAQAPAAEAVFARAAVAVASGAIRVGSGPPATGVAAILGAAWTLLRSHPIAVAGAVCAVVIPAALATRDFFATPPPPPAPSRAAGPTAAPATASLAALPPRDVSPTRFGADIPPEPEPEPPAALAETSFAATAALGSETGWGAAVAALDGYGGNIGAETDFAPARTRWEEPPPDPTLPDMETIRRETLRRFEGVRSVAIEWETHYRAHQWSGSAGVPPRPLAPGEETSYYFRPRAFPPILDAPVKVVAMDREQITRGRLLYDRGSLLHEVRSERGTPADHLPNTPRIHALRWTASGDHLVMDGTYVPGVKPPHAFLDDVDRPAEFAIEGTGYGRPDIDQAVVVASIDVAFTGDARHFAESARVVRSELGPEGLRVVVRMPYAVPGMYIEVHLAASLGWAIVGGRVFTGSSHIEWEVRHDPHPRWLAVPREIVARSFSAPDTIAEVWRTRLTRYEIDAILKPEDFAVEIPVGTSVVDTRPEVAGLADDPAPEPDPNGRPKRPSLRYYKAFPGDPEYVPTSEARVETVAIARGERRSFGEIELEYLGVKVLNDAGEEPRDAASFMERRPDGERSILMPLDVDLVLPDAIVRAESYDADRVALTATFR